MKMIDSSKLDGKYWKYISSYLYRSEPLPDNYLPGQLLTNIATIKKYKLVRNAEIKFQIKIIEESNSIHAAILFRKNGYNFLGAGVGGWSSHFSLFVGNRTKISGWLIGHSSSIEINKVYDFRIKFQSGFITNFTCNNENLIANEFSIKDSLSSNLSCGNIGLYAWNKTVAEIKVKVTPLSIHCFIITNINKDTNSRRDRFINIIKKNNIQCEFIDARDLTRENPLMNKIKNGMISSDFVIADFGFQKPRANVFYETGIAHSLSKPTIHIGPKGKKFNKSIPSDLKSQFFILEEELESELPKTIEKILEQKSENYDYLS
jgi:hypothetical protein